MDIRIPEGLEKLLARDSTLDGAVKSSIAAFEPWIQSSRLPFFPEYTDHGPEHISCVLESAQELIGKQAWESFTASDAAILITAVLLHD